MKKYFLVVFLCMHMSVSSHASVRLDYTTLYCLTAFSSILATLKIVGLWVLHGKTENIMEHLTDPYGIEPSSVNKDAVSTIEDDLTLLKVAIATSIAEFYLIKTAVFFPAERIRRIAAILYYPSWLFSLSVAATALVSIEYRVCDDAHCWITESGYYRSGSTCDLGWDANSKCPDKTKVFDVWQIAWGLPFALGTFVDFSIAICLMMADDV